MDGHFKDEEPSISLDVGPREIEFLVDTGFTGGLMIPEVLANDLDLTYVGAGEFQSATGQPIPVSTYSMEINWLGRRMRIPVVTSTEVREPLLGGDALRDCCLTIDYALRTVLIAGSSR